jgi:hypothetical protein
MRSEWRVGIEIVGERTLYRVYRPIDARGDDEGDNREYKGNYIADFDTARRRADMLNAHEDSDGKIAGKFD